MTREEHAARLAAAIGEVARCLDAINREVPPGEHHTFTALLSTPAVQEEFTLPEPSRALVVCCKQLRAAGRSIPAIAPQVEGIVSSLHAEPAAA